MKLSSILLERTGAVRALVRIMLGTVAGIEQGVGRRCGANS